MSKDWDPEAALKRLADADGVTIEEFHEKLAERAKAYTETDDWVLDEVPPVEFAKLISRKPHIVWRIFCWTLGLAAIAGGVYWMPDIVRHTIMCFICIGFGIGVIDRGMKG